MGSELFGFSTRLPPSNLQAEQALLGALLANNRVRDQCGGLLPIHFADPEYGLVYGRVIELIDAGHKKVDPITLKDEFASPLLANLLASVIGFLGIPEYALQIKSCWMRRQVIDATSLAHEHAFGGTPGETIQDIMVAASARLTEIAEAGLPRDAVPCAMDVVRAAEATIRGDPGSGPVFTGIPCIDSLWKGMWRKRYHLLMARSQTGKTSAMAQFARHIARGLLAENIGEHVHIFCLDTSVTDYQTMNIAQESHWTADQIISGEIGDAAEWLAFEAKAREIDALPIIIDGPPFDLPTLRLRARAVKRHDKTRVLFIDHRALVRRGADQARMSEVEWVPFLGDALKMLATELDLSLVALEQVNKPKSDGEPPRPTRHDIPFNGDRAADELYALYRREIDMPRDAPGLALLKTEEKRAEATYAWEQLKHTVVGQAEFIALKRRMGSLGYRTLRFDGPSMTFQDGVG